MQSEEQHVAVALPSLYGAPAYARPPMRVTPTALPVDRDDLPIAVQQTDEERTIAEELLAWPFGVAERQTADIEPEPSSQPQLLSAIAGRILHRAS